MDMGNAGRNGGEYYTLRPLIRAIVQGEAEKLGSAFMTAHTLCHEVATRGLVKAIASANCCVINRRMRAASERIPVTVLSKGSPSTHRLM